jgi:hypothetical protein
MIAQAMITPKERQMWTGVSEETKKRYVEEKRRNAEKRKRRRGDYDD